MGLSVLSEQGPRQIRMRGVTLATGAKQNEELKPTHHPKLLSGEKGSGKGLQMIKMFWN